MDFQELAEKLAIERLAMLDDLAGRSPFSAHKQLSEWNGNTLAKLGQTGCPLRPNLADTGLSSVVTAKRNRMMRL